MRTASSHTRRHRQSGNVRPTPCQTEQTRGARALQHSDHCLPEITRAPICMCAPMCLCSTKQLLTVIAHTQTRTYTAHTHVHPYTDIASDSAGSERTCALNRETYCGEGETERGGEVSAPRLESHVRLPPLVSVNRRSSAVAVSFRSCRSSVQNGAAEFYDAFVIDVFGGSGKRCERTVQI